MRSFKPYLVMDEHLQGAGNFSRTPGEPAPCAIELCTAGVKVERSSPSYLFFVPSSR